MKSAGSILKALNTQSFDIYKHLGLSGWIFVITEMTQETMSSACTLNSLEKYSSSESWAGISMESHANECV